MKILHFIHAALAAVGFAVTMTSCDEHIEFPDTAMKTCDILCTDGEVVRYSDIESKGKTPIGVVFHVNQDGKTEGTGYAVYLWDVPMAAFSDSTGVKQNTSANPAAFDGNGNTYAMYASGVSSAATSVFDMWKYGQSAYIPSVAQLQLLYASHSINQSLDNIKKHLNAAYFETWKYIQVRIGYWKAQVYRARSIKEIVDGAFGRWRRNTYLGRE